ncbi:T6SS phospholipase effector Tle1-like catalytic domain-containing protein [Pseudomonas yamanorum]
MPEVNQASFCYPPQFPEQGRLPSRAGQVHQNIRRQSQQERDYHDSLCVAAGRRVLAPCSKTLHISLFFDGTGNNLNNDLYLSDPKHPTNIARLFRASIGEGHAGGTAHNSQAQRLTDAKGAGFGQYFKYYMPGVGTPFPEVGDLNYSELGLATAAFGEERINWGLMMIIDALRRTLALPRLDNASLRAAVEAMGAPAGFEGSIGASFRRHQYEKQLGALAKPLRIALTQPSPGWPKLLGVRLYVYGFSRGAAAARAFVSWLNELSSPTESQPALSLGDLKLPISIEYLGLLDTVASVGLAHAVPGADGHMSWADGTQELPTSSLVKRCLHIVASHEQRLCFPLDSIRREGGGYPASSVEVLYPGMHSDQGGGYPPGDQGKAVGPNDGLLLSQIALHDLYSEAFTHGAPLKVPKEALPIDMRHELWRAMEDDLVRAFDLSPVVVSRFNAWRQVTLALIPAPQPLSPEQLEYYQPVPTTDTLENALASQMAWITAWRIDRYAFATLKQTDFYRQASDAEADKTARNLAEANRNKKQAVVEKRRKEQKAREHFSFDPKEPLEPGIKDFDADMAQTQLREAAEEFGRGFSGQHFADSIPVRVSLMAVVPGAHVREIELAERKQMKASAMAKVSQLFPPPLHERNYVDERTRLNVEESRNASKPEGLLRALFDDHAHDSRAWFLYAAGREPFGSYFKLRMVFFGDARRRDIALYREEDGVMVAGAEAPLFVDAGAVAQRPVMTAERLADAQKAIDEIWQAYYDKVREANDVPV